MKKLETKVKPAFVFYGKSFIFTYPILNPIAARKPLWYFLKCDIRKLTSFVSVKQLPPTEEVSETHRTA